MKERNYKKVCEMHNISKASFYKVSKKLKEIRENKKLQERQEESQE